MREGVNPSKQAPNVHEAENVRKRSPRPASFRQPGCLSALLGSMALALSAHVQPAAAWWLVKQGEVILHVFLLRMLFNPGLDSAVTEWTVYPGFLLSKVLEFEWVVRVVDSHAVLVTARRQFCRFPSK